MKPISEIARQLTAAVFHFKKDDPRNKARGEGERPWPLKPKPVPEAVPEREKDDVKKDRVPAEKPKDMPPVEEVDKELAELSRKTDDILKIDDETGSKASRVHKVLINSVLKYNLIDVEVTFECAYDKSHATDKPPEFKWRSYEASIDSDNSDRLEDAKEHGGVSYRLNADLDGNGDIRKDTVRSYMHVVTHDGKGFTGGLPESDPVFRKVDGYVRDIVLPAGVTPTGKTNRNRLSFSYRNSRTGKTYSNTREFLRQFEDYMVPDMPYRREKQVKQEHLEKLQLGDVKNESREQLDMLTRDKKLEVQELKKKERDPERKKLYDDLLEYCDKILEELARKKGEEFTDKVKKYRDDMNSIIETETKHWKEIGSPAPAVPETVKASSAVYAALIGGPKSVPARKFFGIFEKYHAPVTSGWMDRDDAGHLSKDLAEAMLEDRKERAGKPAGTPGSRGEKIEDAEYLADASMAADLYADFLKDLKERRDGFRAKHPDDFGSLKGTEWLDGRGAAEAEAGFAADLKKRITPETLSKAAEKPAGKFRRFDMSGHSLDGKLGSSSPDKILDEIKALPARLGREMDSKLEQGGMAEKSEWKDLQKDFKSLKAHFPVFLGKLAEDFRAYKAEHPEDCRELYGNRADWLLDAGARKDLSGKFEGEMDGLIKRLELKPDVSNLAAFPGPGPECRKFYGILRKYDLFDNDLALSQKWFGSGEALALAKRLSNAIRSDDKVRVKGEDGKDLSKEGLLSAVKDLFPKFLKDLKRRKDKYKSDAPGDFEVMNKARDLNWVDGKMEDVAGKAVGMFGPGKEQEPSAAEMADIKNVDFKGIDVGEAKKLAGLFRKYGVTKPDPSKWLDKEDFAILAQALMEKIHKAFGEEKKGKPEGAEKARAEYEADIRTARKAFPEFLKVHESYYRKFLEGFKDMKKDSEEYGKMQKLDTRLKWLGDVDSRKAVLSILEKKLSRPAEVKSGELPEIRNEKVRELVKTMENAGVTKPNPRLFLGPKDFVEMARSLVWSSPDTTKEKLKELEKTTSKYKDTKEWQ